MSQSQLIIGLMSGTSLDGIDAVLLKVHGLQRLFADAVVRTAGEFGLSGDAKEAICFAILANESVHGNCANLPRVTGARKPVVLGVMSNPAREM